MEKNKEKKNEKKEEKQSQSKADYDARTEEQYRKWYVPFMTHH
jgi:hypothetical protein